MMNHLVSKWKSDAVQHKASGEQFVQSLARGLAIIKAFNEQRQAMTLTDVAKHTGINRAASRRFLLTLKELGYVAMDGRYFRLTPRVLDLGYAYLSSLSLPAIAQPFLEEVTRTIHESCSATILSGSDVVYVARSPAKRIMSVVISIGTKLPAFATSMGRVLVAYLPPEQLEEFFENAEFERYTADTVTSESTLRRILAAVRKQGYAAVDQELEEGLRSIAVPVSDQSGRVVAAINVSGHAARVSTDQMIERFLPPLARAAEGIGRALSR